MTGGATKLFNPQLIFPRTNIKVLTVKIPVISVHSPTCILHKVKLNLTAPLPDTTPANKNATGCSPSQDRLGLAQRELSDTVLRPRNGKYVLKVNRICQNIYVVQEQRKCTHF